MAKMLPLDLIIDIKSTSVKDTFTIGKLNTILIEKYNPELPQEKFTELYDYSTAQNTYGFDSGVAKFSNYYFSFLSKTATAPDRLFVYNWSQANTSPVIKGAEANALSTLKSLNGKFKITIGTASADVEANLTSANSYTECASTLQTAIRGATGQESNAGFTNAKVTYSAITKGFIVTGGTAGNGETIGFLTKADDGVEIWDKLGLSEQEGASLIKGSAGAINISMALDEILNENGNYYLITPNFEFDDEFNTLTDFASFLNNSNDRFAGLYSSSNIAFKTANSDKLENLKAYNGLILDYKTNDYQNGLIAGIISAIDLSKNAGNYNLAFNDANLFKTTAITEKTEWYALESNRVNAICNFGILGQDDAIYMQGFINGTKTDSANVYICNSFLKMNQQIQLYNMLKSQPLIGIRDKKSHDIIYAYLMTAFESAVRARIIATGVELDNTTKQSLNTTFSNLVSDINTVFDAIVNKGYFYIISDLNQVTKTLTIQKLICQTRLLEKS